MMLDNPELPDAIGDESLASYMKRLTPEQWKLFNKAMFEWLRPTYCKALPHLDPWHQDPDPDILKRLEVLEKAIHIREEKGS